jgi:membrane-bound lytic murein transglycosylase D
MCRMLSRAARCGSALALVLALSASGAGAQTAAPSVTDHQKGPRPREPRDRLPEGSALPAPDERARRAIADGATAEELEQGPVDSELLALRDAERVLFSEQLPGAMSGWSFEMPETVDDGHALGLPYATPPAVSAPGLAQEDVEWLKSLTLPDLPIVLDRRVVTYLKFYRDSDQGRAIAAIWTKKSGRYVAEMKAQLRRAGLPTDLVWLSMIESGHNPSIKSPAGAVGLWQFMPESGRMYGLVVDRWVDERRDPGRSTQAAVRFLSDLYRRFGNWELAMAAYNMGYAGLSRAVSKFSTNDYWALSRMESGMPWETTLYVPKIFALAIVMNNRAAFGVGRTPLDPPVAFDTVMLEPATQLQDIAQAASISILEVRELNPQYVVDRLPPEPPSSGKRWAVRLPVGAGEAAMKRLLGKKTAGAVALHRTRLGDSIATLAVDLQVPASTLETLNDLAAGERLEAGTVIFVPPGAKPKLSALPEDVVVGRAVQPGAHQRRVFYQVVAGDSLTQVASALGVKEMDLCRWNLLNPSALLREGMTLQVLIDDATTLAHVRTLEEGQAHVLIAGSPEFHEYFEGLKGKQRLIITVRPGDTLSGIGARYGMTVGSMERVNRRSRKQKLLAGEQLIVYSERDRSQANAGTGVDPLPPLPDLGP